MEVLNEWTASQKEAEETKKKAGEEKPKGIYELLGFAMGVLGMSYDDFCRLGFDEFGECCKAWNQEQQSQHKAAWERTRMLAAITIQPHTKKKIDPKKMLPFPWETKSRKANVMTQDESRKRLERRLERIKLPS